MITSMSHAASTSDVLSQLAKKLFPWTVAALVSACAVSSPATDSIGLWTPPGYVCQVGISSSSYASAALNQPDEAVSLDAQIAALRDAQIEARLGLQLLQRFAGEFGITAIDNYVAAVDRALEGTSENPSARDAAKFAHALRSARGRLLDEVPSFGLWLKLSDAIDPEGGPRRIPVRFVRWKTAEESKPLEFTKSDSRVQRAVADFLRDDAHPGFSRG